MQTRKLKRFLNDTKYIISNCGDYLAVGSGYIHNIISVDVKTLDLKTSGNRGRDDLAYDELKQIYDKLRELIDNGAIKEIIEQDDVIESPVSVYTYDNGRIITKYAEKYGWPNVTHDGFLMYENQYFKTPHEAVEAGMENYKASIELWERSRLNVLDNLQKIDDGIAESKKYLNELLTLKPET